MRYRFFSAAIFLLFSFGCAIRTPSLPAGEEPSGITGTVRNRDGSPAGGAFVYAYRNTRGGLRGPADFEASIDNRGEYFLDLAPGNYHLVARSRRRGADVGPPRSGDAWALYPGNPVAVQAQRKSRADFRLQAIVQPMLLKESTLNAGDTGYTGRLTDTSGQGVTGAFVLAYRDGDMRRMPDATSPAVGEDGVFTLFLPTAGRWCLAARTRTRGQPVAGELYGVLGKGEEGCRQVRSGELQPIGTIILHPHP